MDRKQPSVGKINGEFRAASADDPLRRQQRDGQPHHGRQREQKNDQRQQNRRGKHIGPQPSDIAGPEEPCPADQH